MILDGANGTELERLGVRMDQDLWRARALADCPDRVHQVHRRYIDTGADVITTNSFSATREAMQRCELAAHFEDWNRRSVRIALEERERSSRARSIVVAGSVSTYGRCGPLDLETMSDHFRAQGEILVDEGVDLLVLETLGSTARQAPRGHRTCSRAARPSEPRAIHRKGRSPAERDGRELHDRGPLREHESGQGPGGARCLRAPMTWGGFVQGSLV